MALLKHKNDDFGNGGISYWKIVETNIDWLNQKAHIVIAGYLDQEARLNGKRPLEIVSFDWNEDEFPFTIERLNEENENILTIAYEKIKESKKAQIPIETVDENGNLTITYEEGEELNFFVDAEDC